MESFFSLFGFIGAAVLLLTGCVKFEVPLSPGPKTNEKTAYSRTIHNDK
ncbi:MAG: hypothetical protein K0R59_183 [Sphingobacterium sp.]|jgi:hypothetical protein|nr:hypothetical protein [Sphingobacterium sp.]